MTSIGAIEAGLLTGRLALPLNVYFSAMATRYRFADSYTPHFVTFSTIQWVDALSRPVYKDIIVQSLQFCIREKALLLHAWVIMSNHVHLIISSQHNRLEDIMRDLKKFTSGEVVRAIEGNPQESRKNWMLWLFRSAGELNPNNKNYQFWQQDNHPIALDKSPIIQQKLDYIHDNPVKAGLVYEPWQYPYSSALDYYGKGTGVLPLELLI